jgi:multidrug efflux pump subunit AcrB
VRDLLVSVLAAALLAALGLAALAAVTLAPWVVALQLADARRRSAAGWGAAALAGSGLALAVGLVLHQAGAGTALAAGALLVLAWAVPVALWRSGLPAQDRVGAHQQGAAARPGR